MESFPYGHGADIKASGNLFQAQVLTGGVVSLDNLVAQCLD
jgi:hypothetical protein